LLFLVPTAESELQAVCQLVESRAPPLCGNNLGSTQISGGSLNDAASKDEQQCGSDRYSGGNIADACVNGRRQRSRQAGIQDAFDAKTEACDNTSRGIDDR
jgi:hypothetical protein